METDPAPGAAARPDATPPAGLPATDAVPLPLRELAQWVAWRSDPPRKDGAKRTKVPIDPHTGKKASVTAPETWGTYEQACARAVADKLAGVGFVFAPDGDIFGVDLDTCRDPETGVIAPWAQEIVTALDTYSEVSPSGTGAHSLGRGRLPNGGRRKNKIELYDSARYFTFTGVHIEGTPTTIETRTQQVAALHAKVFGGRAEPAPEAASTSGPAVTETDLELTDRLRAGPSGAKFESLWRGDHSAFPSQSEADLALCGLLALATNGDELRVDRLFRQSALMREKWDQRRGKQTYGQRTVVAAIRGGAARSGSSREQGVSTRAEGDKRPDVKLIRGYLHVAVDMAEAALKVADDPIVFQRGVQLVGVARLNARHVAGGLTRWAGTPEILPYDVAGLCDRFGRAVRFVIETKDGDLVPVDCPEPLAKRVLSRAGRWDFRVLRGILQAPTILANGEILSDEGHHDESGFLLDFGGYKFPAVCREPSADDIRGAVAALRELLAGFPFVEETDRAVAVSAIATTIARPAFPTAPGHGFTAPEMATGKSLLGHTAAYLATGRRASVLTQGPDENEDRKRIFALLLAGVPIAMLDNVMRPIEGAALASVLTEESFQDRILGLSKQATVPTTATTWIFTGNNLIVKGDLRTRVLPSQLDARVERPWERKFTVDYRRLLRERRGEFVAAVLTILRGHAVAGHPATGLREFGRYELWSRVIRAALVWAGFADPVAALQRLEDSDPESLELQRLHHAWRLAVGREVATAGECIKRAATMPLAQELLRDLAAARSGDAADPVRLGKLVSRHEGRVRAQQRFERAGMHGGVVNWRLSPVLGGDGGVVGVVPNASQEAESSDRGRVDDTRTHEQTPLETVGNHPTTPTNPTNAEESSSASVAGGKEYL